MTTGMNVQRFTARTARDALRLVREALGEDAVVLSTKPSAGGVEVLAMPSAQLGQIERFSAASDAARPPREEAPRTEPLAASSVEQDAARLEMSTLSFQDYVRKRMLKRRQAAIAEPAAEAALAECAALREAAETKPASAPTFARRSSLVDVRVDDENSFPATTQMPLPTSAELYASATLAAGQAPAAAPAVVPQTAREPLRARTASPAASHHAGRDDIGFEAIMPGRGHDDMLAELRSMKGMIEERFGALAFMERLQRRPAEARLTQRLLDCGFSPALVRKIAEGLSPDVEDENAWVAQVLERNVHAAEAETAIEDRTGVFALIGPTGVGKTTTTAKIAAAFAAKHGAGQLGLITLDAYRVGAHEQLRAYGRILGVPVHTAHDRASLEDLLDLLAAKKMVLIDTAGMAQRDARTKELLDMVSHRAIQRLLVINAASQGETIEDVLISYRSATCAGVVLSKLDEAVKLGPAVDAAIRHRLKLVGIANGQRVPEDWHRLSASALVQRALRGGGTAAWRLDACETQLIFAAPIRAAHAERAVAA